MGENKHRYNIGLLVGNVEDDFSARICQGAMQEAERLDVNLFIIPVKYLQGKEEKENPLLRYEYQYNTLAQYATCHSLDFILCALSCIGFKVSHEESLHFLQTLSPIPMLLLSCAEPGYSNIVFDNKSSISNAIDRWVASGIRKIGMIYGDLDNLDARERFEAYQETLSKHNIPYQPDYTIQGNYTTSCRECLKEWYTAHSDIEAIVVMSDSIALLLYDILQEQGVRIGKDCRILGFDDIQLSKHAVPPLATIQASPQYFGIFGIQEAVRRLDSVSGDRMALSKCPPTRITVPTSFIHRESFDGISQPIAEESQDELHQYKDQHLAFIDFDHELNITNRDLFFLAANPETFAAKQLQHFHIKQIPSCYVFSYYREISVNQAEDFQLPDYIYLSSYRNDDKVTALPKVSQQINTQDVFRNRYLPEDRKTYMMIDIYNQEYQYGFLLCELPYEFFHYAESICYLFGTATRMAHLIREQEQLMEERETYARKLKQENEELNNLSYTDLLTGIYNRRGFIHYANKLLTNTAHADKQAYTIYCDLNYLKKINDQYGHEEGDFSIHECASALQLHLPEGSIAGRIGGDEFAALVIAPVSADSLYHTLKAHFEQSNAQKAKPYPISISIGIHTFTIAPDCSIESLLEQADQTLYIDKATKPLWRTV